MKVEYLSGHIESMESPCLVVLATRDGRLLNGSPQLERLLQPFVASGELGSGSGEYVYLIEPKGIKAGRVLFFNAGKSIDDHEDIRRGTAEAWKVLSKKGVREVSISLAGLDRLQALAAVEGFALMDYCYDALKTEENGKPSRLRRLCLYGADKHRSQIDRALVVLRGTNLARDLCVMPANILTPEKFAEFAVEWGAVYGFRTTVMGEAEMLEMGMGAMYSVGQGSACEAKFTVMEYEPQKPSGKTFALVGKAVTFDSGGLSLKPGSSMPDMKGDMGGGAAVLGVMTVLRDTGCPHRVVGLVPSTENMPSGSATRPSDVVTTLSGLTVQIDNTDAEGRLILADALTYAARFQPDFVVDFATLTGACLVALGPKVYGVMGNHQPLVDAILKAGEEVHEPFWQLPLVEDYKEYLKSDTADICNISSVKWGGAITAGLFLERFAEKYRWAHCDIAAAILEKKEDYHPKGGTGVGVRMTLRMMELLEGGGSGA